jgi:GNAT superfamily N-acetyltransferase
MAHPPELLDRAHDCYIESFRLCARIAHHGAVEEEDGLVLISTGATSAGFNPAFVTRPPSDPSRAVARARAFYARRGVSWIVRATDGMAADAVAPMLATLGFTQRRPGPGMLLAPLVGQITELPELSIEVVQDAKTLRTFTDTLAAGFEGPRTHFAVLDDPRFLTTPDVVFYLGWVEGVPVATALRVTSNRIVGVYSVATVPAYRHRGYGEALTRWATFHDVNEGCLGAYLQASDAGLPTYRRIGYRTVFAYQSWEPPR